MLPTKTLAGIPILGAGFVPPVRCALRAVLGLPLVANLHGPALALGQPQPLRGAR